MTASPWTEALVFALTGERRTLAQTEAPDAQAVVAALGGRPVQPAAIAAARREADAPWPVPLPDDLRASLPSLAQFYAALQRLVDDLDLSPHLSRAQRAPDADERRLLADRPPHWGRVR